MTALRTLSTTAILSTCLMAGALALKLGPTILDGVGLGGAPTPFGTVTRPSKLEQSVEAKAARLRDAPASLPDTQAREAASSALPPVVPVPMLRHAAAGEPAARTDVTGSIAAPGLDGPRETRQFQTVDVVDGRTLTADGLIIRLGAMTLAKPEVRCQLLDGSPENCRDRARTRLELLTRHRPVQCVLTPAAGGAVSGRCRIGTTDLSLWLIREGWAIPTENEDDLLTAMAEAKRLRVGMWR